MVLVTGATGFLGTHLICELLNKGYTVKAMKRKSSSLHWFNLVLVDRVNPLKYSNLTWVEADILDIDILDNTMHDIDVCFHAAALVSFDDKDKEALYKTNIEGTANIVNACIKANTKLIYISSTAALGYNLDHTPVDESSKWENKKNPNAYANSKYNAQLEVWRGIEEGLDASIINPSLIYGEGNYNDGSCKLFKNIMSNFPFYSTGANAFVYVGDVAKAAILLFETNTWKQQFVICGENMSFKYFFHSLAKNLNKKAPWIAVGKILSNILWPIFVFFARITFSRPIITKSSAQSSVAHIVYLQSKFQNHFPDFKFEKFDFILPKVCSFYLKLKKLNT